MATVDKFALTEEEFALLGRIAEADANRPEEGAYANVEGEDAVRAMWLADKGLLQVVKFPAMPTCATTTLRGRDLLHDEAERRKTAEKERRKQVRHDWLLTLAGIVGGLFSGCLASLSLNAALAAIGS